MTKVTVSKKDNKIFEVECDGHTNYGERGEDIVCASLSSVVQTAILGLLMIVMIEIDMKRDDDKNLSSAIRIYLLQHLKDKIKSL